MERYCPQPPPLLGLTTNGKDVERRMSQGRRSAASRISNVDLLERLFSDGYRADVSVYTNDGIVPAHASILVTPYSILFFGTKWKFLMNLSWDL